MISFKSFALVRIPNQSIYVNPPLALNYITLIELVFHWQVNLVDFATNVNFVVTKPKNLVIFETVSVVISIPVYTRGDIFNNYSSSPNGLWLRGHEGERNNCFSKFQLVGQKNIKTKHLSQLEARLQSSFTAKTLQIWRHFSLLVCYNI